MITNKEKNVLKCLYYFDMVCLYTNYNSETIEATMDIQFYRAENLRKTYRIPQLFEGYAEIVTYFY